MVEFGGWMMPLQYSSMRDEHHAVRHAVGLFDVSHMGEFRMDGPRAETVLQRIVTNDVATLAAGQARYNLICAGDGGIIDDALVYRHGPERFTVVVNAGPRAGDLDHFRELGGADCEPRDATMEVALLAVQGPRALATLKPLADVDLNAIGYYHFQEGHLGGLPAEFSRTGYTGEDGFEVFLAWADAGRAWDAILEAGAEHGI